MDQRPKREANHGYVENKDLSDDIIVSGGNRIRSEAVEAVLHGHPAVLEAGVVAMPHPRWGEAPCAFVTLNKEFSDEGDLSEEDIVSFCRNSMPGFMAPRKVVFVEELPKTAAGKIWRSRLREAARGFRVAEKKRRTPQGGATGSAPLGNAPAVGGTNGGDGRPEPEEQEHVPVIARL